MAKCRNFCKWLNYHCVSDKYESEWNFESYKCDKYKKDLGKTPEKCEECLNKVKVKNCKYG